VDADSRKQVAADRWRRVQDVYHRVLECDETQRAIWLEEACAGDEDLRREVESLLDYATVAEHFMEEPAIEEADSAEDSGSLSEGQQVGSYRILSRLGAGGMGQVYLAKDTRLARTVAIKVLGREKVADAGQKRHFLHEARAVSALNHPNIVTLHDIVSDSNFDFLVMEYVEGRSLDKCIPRRGLPLKRLALGQSGRADVAVVELDKGGLQRLTSEGMNHTPIWSPDGRAVTFDRLGRGIFQVPLAGGSSLEALLETEAAGPGDWTPDNTTLVYVTGDPRGIWMLRRSNGGVVSPPLRLLTDTKIRYVDPDVSPDRRWLAYVSTESGLPQVNVQAFPGLGNKVTVSQDGGNQPRWSHAGRELFYLAADDRAMMVVDVQTNAGLRASPPRVLLPAAGPFDVDPTGERFLVLIQEKPGELHLVTNWFQELRQKVPTSD
jgi:hypothetical protein